MVTRSRRGDGIRSRKVSIRSPKRTCGFLGARARRLHPWSLMTYEVAPGCVSSFGLRVVEGHSACVEGGECRSQACGIDEHIDVGPALPGWRPGGDRRNHREPDRPARRASWRGYVRGSRGCDPSPRAAGRGTPRSPARPTRHWARPTQVASPASLQDRSPRRPAPVSCGVGCNWGVPGRAERDSSARASARARSHTTRLRHRSASAIAKDLAFLIDVRHGAGLPAEGLGLPLQAEEHLLHGVPGIGLAAQNGPSAPIHGRRGLDTRDQPRGTSEEPKRSRGGSYSRNRLLVRGTESAWPATGEIPS